MDKSKATKVDVEVEPIAESSCRGEDSERISEELDKFDKVVSDLYALLDTNPSKVITESQKLLQVINTNPDPYNIKGNKQGELFDLRAETFYKSGDYHNSIKEIYNSAKNTQERFGGNFSFGDEHCIHMACNYIKLRDAKRAKLFLDSVALGLYITDYVWANYYEIIGSTKKAIKAYHQILQQDELDHYFFYKDAIKRAEELSKDHPKLLNELFYPSSRPNNPICIDDNERRTKMFDLINALPEVKSCEGCNTVMIYKEPKQTKSSKYWIKVGHDNGGNMVSQFNFFVDTLTYEITYLDTRADKELTLSNWRKKK